MILQTIFSKAKLLTSNMQLKEPKHEILSISSKLNDDGATDLLRSTLKKMEGGEIKSKVLLKFTE